MENLKLKSSAYIVGRVMLTVIDIDGNERDNTGWIYNTITNAALAEVSGLVGNVGSKTAFTYLAVGTDNTAESAAHTTLQAEITDSGLTRTSVTPTQETTTQTDDTLQLYKEWTATGTKAVEEIGIFNASSDGTMLGRKLTTTTTVNNGEKLQATYQIIFAGA